MMDIILDGEALRPMVEIVVAEVLQQMDQRRAETQGRLAFSESEAATLLGVQRHTLRDSRLRGEIEAKKIGKRWFYSLGTLKTFLKN